VTTRVKEVLKNENYQILENDQDSLVVAFEKTQHFCEEVLGVLLSLEKNGDFKSLYVSKLQLSDLLAPLLLPKNSKAAKAKQQPNPFEQSMIGDIRDLD
jgi:hypothetical protein